VSAQFLGVDPAQMKAFATRLRDRDQRVGGPALIDAALKFKVIPRMLAPDEILCSCAFHK